MKKNVSEYSSLNLRREGAQVLLSSTINFLLHSGISGSVIRNFAVNYINRSKKTRRLQTYKDVVQTWEKLSVMMSTWFSDPKFLDSLGNPVPLSTRTNASSLKRLIRASRIEIDPSVALELMRHSPSVKFQTDGKILALRRVFVIPDLEVPRAAFVVERFLETLVKNAKGRRRRAALLLERSCHVSQLDLTTVAPVLRDIETYGSAFMDSIDGEIEGRRLRRPRRKGSGELGVLVFAWTKPNIGLDQRH